MGGEPRLMERSPCVAIQMDYGLPGNSGVERYADNARLGTMRAAEAGGLPALPRVFNVRRGIGKRSAPGVRDRDPHGPRPVYGARSAEGG